MAQPRQALPAAAPKLFVSYSWTNPDHEAWVLHLATELRESGIDVILDKWDLKEGHDAHAFMEKMVTDPDIKKVMLVCDRVYAEKTDGRKGGVGTEAQIISAEIYQKQDQDKFVAVLKERDANGRPYLPTYYRSRIYIDLSDPGTYSENFDRLLRWAYNQPVYQKPQLGQKPEYLVGEAKDATPIVTSSRLRRALEAIRDARPYALPAVADYLTALCNEFEKLRLDPHVQPFDDAVVRSIESFLPYRNEAIEVFINLATHLDTLESRNHVHRFFEQGLSYFEPPKDVISYRDSDWDNYRFIVHELFLYAIATLIRFERFESAAYLMTNQYYVPDRSRFGKDPMVPFVWIRQYMTTLENRNNRLKLGRLSLRADMLKERCKQVAIEFRHLMQADFILFMRSSLDNKGQSRVWFPETLVYHHQGPFEIFVRSRSLAYFNRAKSLLRIEDKSELEPVLKSFADGTGRLPTWQFETINPKTLLGFDQLATIP